MNNIILAPIFCIFFCFFITDGSEIATINESIRNVSIIFLLLCFKIHKFAAHWILIGCEGKIILHNSTLKSCRQAGGKCCVSFSGQGECRIYFFDNQKWSNFWNFWYVSCLLFLLKDENPSGKKISSLPTMLKMLKESTSSNYECSQCWDEYSGIFEIDGEIFAHYNWMNGRFGRK